VELTTAAPSGSLMITMVIVEELQIALLITASWPQFRLGCRRNRGGLVTDFARFR
jgi:hypothetical protein